MKKHFLAILAISAFLGGTAVSCGSSSSNSKTTTAAAQNKGMEVDSVLKNADKLVGQTVVLEGVCTHICQHGGGKIFLMGSDDTQTIRIDAGQKIGSFSPETVNSLVRIQGTVQEERIDEAFLNQWESQIKAQVTERHGEGGVGCESDQKARGEAPAGSIEERIANFRKRIAERKANEGKDYLSFYSITADNYEIL